MIGLTASLNFPLVNAFQSTLHSTFHDGYYVYSDQDAFVTKIDSTGSSLVYSTFLGGYSYDEGRALALFGDAIDTSNTSARAQSLRQIAENQKLYNSEFNRAFVLMEYFGYLRRNPNERPDTGYSGYDFWLNKLNAFNGDYQKAEMVKAFITSGEYRSRFGPL